MKKIKAAGYARVSTLLGQDVEHQLHGIRELSSNRDYEYIESYIDQGISGKKEKRPSLDRLVRDAKMGKFSILIVHSIDRLGRSTKHLLTLIDEFRHYGVSLISIRENLDFSSPVGQMALTMLASVAQLEGQLISERIKTSLAVKKKLATESGNNWKCGRPQITDDLKAEVLRLHQEGLSIRSISNKLDKISKSSVAKILKESRLSIKPS